VEPHAPEPDAPASDFSWHVCARLAEIDGEARANLLRGLGIALFYGLELAAFHGVSLGPLALSHPRSSEQHGAISLLAGAWALMSVAVTVLLRRRFVPPALKFATTAGDLVFLTAILAVSDGPRSPLTVAYLLVIALAALRMSLPLVRVATAASGACWLVLLGVSRANGTNSIPRYAQVVFLLAIVFLGVMLGQAVRRARRVAEEYAERRVTEALDLARKGPA